MNFSPEQTANINIRISKLLKEQSSNVLNSLGITQSQYIRDSLIYVVNNHSLPWQNNRGSITSQFSTWQHMLYDFIATVTTGTYLHNSVVNNLCVKIDELQYQVARMSEEEHNQGVTSIPLNRTSNLLTQLNSMLKYQCISNNQGIYYTPPVCFQIKLVADNLVTTINTNNL
ncbi:type II toxin-antitoxin system RelB/DinJ family antitoxin [Photobacterium damselae]|uniref:type II toxin-antitoxin system RelB/DinJ family antitoxin n=1 Tax=Photobacterium damselae TaxID=38293 RepID=UPI0023EC97F0|nr:type II toxin-antitoxin system RelB/DinJ family antitoxin [Vibrio parahaemolyticus]